LTLEEAAAFLKVKKRTIYDLVQRKRIPYLKIGKLLRFSKQNLLEWMQRETESGQ
jgi:excisionase family DNA binding protein